MKTSPKAFQVVLIFSWVFLSLPNGFAQTELEKKEEKIIDLGLISLSPEYSLGPEKNYIIYQIRNNSSEVLSTIYGWIYIYKENEKGGAENYTLVNNPHRGAILIEGKPQLPGQWGQWRFPIHPPPKDRNGLYKYRLQVFDRGIFFLRLPRSSIAKTY